MDKSVHSCCLSLYVYVCNHSFLSFSNSMALFIYFWWNIPIIFQWNIDPEPCANYFHSQKTNRHRLKCCTRYTLTYFFCFITKMNYLSLDCIYMLYIIHFWSRVYKIDKLEIVFEKEHPVTQCYWLIRHFNWKLLLSISKYILTNVDYVENNFELGGWTNFLGWYPYINTYVLKVLLFPLA